jgi:hypothetical protein
LRKGAGAVELDGLENRCAGNGTVGSNPTPSAIFDKIRLMQKTKRVSLVILSPLFVLLLFAATVDIGFVRTVSHPVTVKRLISNSGVYTSVVPNSLSQTKTIQTSIGVISTSDPDIIKASNAALRPQFIQQNTEMAIDNIYQWLNGQLAQPNFTIDLSGVKTLFANNIAVSLQKRLSALPVCTQAQRLAIAQSGFNAYEATCLPRGVSQASIAEQARTDIINQQDFIKNTTVNPSSIKNSGSRQSVFQDPLAGAPAQYQNAKKSPWIITLMAAIIGLAIVFLSRTKLLGLKHIGIDLLIAGVVMLAMSWALGHAAGTQIAPKIKVDNLILQQDVRKLVADVIQQVDKNYWIFGIAYSAIGLAAIAATMIIPRKRLSGNKSGKRLFV